MRKVLLILVSIHYVFQATAQWNTDPATNTVICSVLPNARTQVTTVPDGANGMFIAWIDGRTNAGGSIYLQRVNHLNSQLFPANGVLVSGTTVSKGNLGMIPDGAGGVIISWTENSDIFARRFNANGNAVWTTDKNLSVTTAGTQSGPVMAVVNSTQAMVAFVDSRNSATSGNDIYLQKIDLATGNLLLATDTPVCKATLNQTAIQIIPDGNGGVFVAWQDPRVATTNTSVYAMRMKNDGLPDPMWTIDGNVICNETGNQNSPVMISDNNGGAYITWLDFRAGATNGDIYAQRVNADGSIPTGWTINGEVVNKNIGSQTLPQVVAVNDGAIFAWTDPRVSTSDRNIFAQKLSLTNGDTLWAPSGGGVKICDAAGNQPPSTSDGIRMVADAANGAIIMWVDPRNSATSGNDIYAQRINNAGVTQWTDNGVLICNAAANQGSIVAGEYCAAIDGALIVWQDSRSGTSNTEIYGALVNSSGNLTSSVRDRQPLEGKIKAYPVPASREIYLSLSRVKPGAYTVQVADISGRLLMQKKIMINGSEGLIETRVEELLNGVYFIKLIHDASKTESVFKFTKQ